MQRVALIDVVGLTGRLLGPDMPRLSAFARSGSVLPVKPALPAVTCTAQSNYLTGESPARHGIVGNGWYHRELSEVQFWKQSNHLVGAPKIWEELRQLDPAFTCAKLFWWYNMYSSADYSITPRPMYPADGRKVFDIYTWPYSIRADIKKDLGEFPFPAFWGPSAGASMAGFAPDAVSRWIAASARWIEEKYQPTLSLVYLPHLDYNLQRYGPEDARCAPDLRLIDEIAGQLIDFYRSRGVTPLIVSEYGITSVRRPIHLNRLFRQQQWLVVKEELGLELLDPGASQVFAVADHQVAHIYVRDRGLIPTVRGLLEKTPGVQLALDETGKTEFGLNHPRAGDLVAVSEADAWFTYYYWLEDRFAPDFARTVDIHRKPGYDPVELFLDPELPLPKAKIAWTLLKKKLGFRTLMNVIPLQAELVRGSHGRNPEDAKDFPVFISPDKNVTSTDCLSSTDIYAAVKAHVLGVTGP